MPSIEKTIVSIACHRRTERTCPVSSADWLHLKRAIGIALPDSYKKFARSLGGFECVPQGHKGIESWLPPCAKDVPSALALRASLVDYYGREARRLVPLREIGNGDVICVQLPSDASEDAPIVRFMHEFSLPGKVVVWNEARSLGALLKKVLASLQ